MSAHREVLERLFASRAFLFDMDGTLVLGDRRNHGLAPLPGAREIVQELSEAGVPVAVFTNGTTRTPGQYARALRQLGFGLTESAVLTPAVVTVETCVRRGHRRVMLLGGKGLSGPLEKAGVEVVGPTGRPKVDAVVVGWFREVRFENLEAACWAVWDGALLYSASQSLYFASAEGKSLGTSRAISAVVTDLTGRRPEIMGKPSLSAIRCAARRLKVATRQLAVVGDDPELEVPMAHRGHALAVAVGTGIGSASSFENLEKSRRPHLMVSGVDELLELYRKRPTRRTSSQLSARAGARHGSSAR